MSRAAQTVTIASGQTVSDAADLGRACVVGLVTPAALTSTALTFQASVDGTTYVPIHATGGTAVSLTVSTSRYIPLDPATFRGVRYLKVVGGSAEGGARTITLVVEDIDR